MVVFAAPRNQQLIPRIAENASGFRVEFTPVESGNTLRNFFSVTSIQGRCGGGGPTSEPELGFVLNR